MIKWTILLALVFSVMFLSTGCEEQTEEDKAALAEITERFGEWADNVRRQLISSGWTKVVDYPEMDIFVDLKNSKKQGGYVYYWYFLFDKISPHASKNYMQGDCKLFRYKALQTSIYVGDPSWPSFGSDHDGDNNWGESPQRGSYGADILETVCRHTN